MGNIRLVSSALLALAVAACGDDGGNNTPDALVIVDSAPIDTTPPIDQTPAVTYNMSCYQNSAPTTIADDVTVAGTTQEVNLLAMTIQPAAGVTVTACLVNATGECTGNDNLGSVGPTTAAGTFTTASIETNGAAVNGYLRATKTGSWTTYLFPHASLTESLIGAPVLMVSQGLVNLLGQIPGGSAQDAGNGIVGVAVTDCSNPPVGIPNATVTVRAGTTEVGDDPLDVGSLLGAAEAAGMYLVTNVPPGEVTIHATYVQNGTTYTFLVNDARSYADALTTVQVKPGY